MAKAHRKTDKYRLIENRGTGELENYIPWHNIVEVGSRGSSYRPFGIKTNRIHKFLSRIEYNYFQMVEWNDSVMDIREQFPLDLNNTRQIAKEIGVKHSMNKGKDMIMSTDFLLTVKTEDGIKYLARAIKPESELSKERTIEKLSIEREYWNRQGIDWKVITKKDLPDSVVRNLEKLRPNYIQYQSDNPDERVEHFLLKRWSTYEDSAIVNVISMCGEVDIFFGIKTGSALRIFKAMVYGKQIKVDIESNVLKFKKIKKENENE